MSGLQRFALLLCAWLILSGALLQPAAAQPTSGRSSYILATATTGGTFYPVGVALATLTKVKLEPAGGPTLSAISSAGSAENVKLLREGQVQFGILQGIYGVWAWDGTGELRAEGPQPHLRSITTLWYNVEHWVVRERFAPTGTAADLAQLKNRRLSIGARNSGTEGSGREILTNLGFDPDTDFDLVYLGYGPSADGLQNGTIDAANLAAGPPVAAVTRAFASGTALRVLNFTDEELARVNGPRRLWSRYVVPAGTYPGQDAAVNTIAHPNFLAVHEDVPEEDVYEILKATYADLPFLRAIHRATADMSLERAMEGLPLPLHPGALRFYREQGLAVPSDLMPPEGDG